MTEESLKFQISQSDNSTLKTVYEHCCEEYRRRLCEQWEIMPSQTSWHGALLEGCIYIDFIGGIVLDMEQLRLIVENNIKLDDFIRYWDYASKTEKGVINMKNWFINRVRPKDYDTDKRKR